MFVSIMHMRMERKLTLLLDIRFTTIVETLGMICVFWSWVHRIANLRGTIYESN